MYIIIKYEYIHNDEQLHETYIIEDITEKTTILKIKQQLNNSFLYGNLDPYQYEIYKHGEQEDTTKQSGNGKYYYTYKEPETLDNDNNTIKDYNIISGELLYLRAKLKIMLNIVRFNICYFYTHDKIEDIKTHIITLYKEKDNTILKHKQINIYYGDTKLNKDHQISEYNIYNNSTLNIDINYNIK
jgi:hypothetical protein